MSCRKKTLYFHHENRKRTTGRFFNGFSDIVLIHWPSVMKVPINQMRFEIFQTQNGFELLPDSAQIFYRRALVHNNFKEIPFTLSTIAEYAGLKDSNQRNLATTVETNILGALKDHGLIDSYEKVGDNSKMPKYIIRRSGAEIK
jgi:hypothetical protein